jgi:hypothetical protein
MYTMTMSNIVIYYIVILVFLLHITRYSLLITHYSLLITHYSLLITHYLSYTYPNDECFVFFRGLLLHEQMLDS